jgi:hypothetical protein
MAPVLCARDAGEENGASYDYRVLATERPRRLSDEEELGGWWFSVAVEMIYLLSRSVVPDRRARELRHGIRRCWLSPLGWAWTPTAWAAEGRFSTLQAIHAPLITTTTAPAGTVGGVLAGPIVWPYTKLRYMSTCAAAQRAPAHLGSVPERHTATLRRMLPTKASTVKGRGY